MFADRQQEARFQDFTSRERVGAHRIVWTVTSIIWAALALLDPAIAGSPGNHEVIRSVRWAMLVPIAVTAAAGWLPISTFVRIRVPLSAVAAASVVAGPLLMAAFVPDPMATDAGSSAVAIIVTTFVMCVWCGATALPLWVPILANVGQAIGFGMLSSKFPGRQEGAVLVWFWLTVVLGLLSAWMLDRARRRTFLAREELEKEKQRSEALLHNMLPTQIAERLKSNPGRIADHFPAATVLFCDLVGFTTLASQLPPAEVVAALDDLFSRFDDLAKKHGLEKIKTIGDAYMAVGGVPTPRPDHAEAVAQMALEMREAIAGVTLSGRPLTMRIGIHTGPVVAGVIGKQKFIYDLWGDAVNTASRMESHGVDGAVQVSEATHALLEGRFVLKERGPVQVKGKGEMRTWLLEGRR